MTTYTSTTRTGRLGKDDCDIDLFRESVSEQVDLANYPHATSVRENVLIYDARSVEGLDANTREAVQNELAQALLNGPGIIVFEGAFTEAHGLSEATDYFMDTIAGQHAAGTNSGDHFAKPGSNDRVWSALQKLAVDRPEVFTEYYANEVLALVSQAWLGPMYQVTSSINVVNPGGRAQNPHRDYHLGFMSVDTAAAFPAHVHRLSPALTLQGAVAHCDMPLESGPTMYLPFSQRYEPGYIAFNLPEFREYFAQNYIQLPLRVGDAVFFNPALFHAAGHNTSTGIRRIANLLQVSSAFGRAIDTVDRKAIVEAIYPSLLRMASSSSAAFVGNVIAASAEGYAFPTNLDRDRPTTGLAGETQAELVARAVDAAMPAPELTSLLDAQERRRRI